MTFQALIKKLSKDYEITLISCIDVIDLTDVALLDGKHSSNSKSTLYFGYDKQLISSAPPSHCILASTRDFDIPVQENIALVSEESLFTIFNDVKLYLKNNSSKGIFEELATIADHTHSIESVIDAASIRLGNSLIFCDRNFKIIASSSTYPVTDSLWIENTKQGYCSYDFINEVKELESIKNASFTTASVEVTCPLSPYRKLSSKVFHNQTQVGFLLMLEGENQILPSHFDMLSLISHVISYTIAFYISDLFEGKSMYHEILYDMLIGAPAQDILPRLKSLSFPKTMQVLFIRSTRYMGPQHMKEFTAKLLKAKIPETHTTFIDKGIVALIPSNINTSDESDLLNICDNLCNSEHLRIGISNSFCDIENFANYYNQAHSALLLGQKLKSSSSTCKYCDYQIFDLFTETKNPQNLGKFCHPALGILRRTDLENHSELYKTLCVYIEHSCSIKLTSEALFIHRNSLVYRLNRIIELCHLNLADANTLFLLRLSFLIDRYNDLNTISEWQ